MVFDINGKRLYKLQSGANNQRTNNALYGGLGDDSDHQVTARNEH